LTLRVFVRMAGLDREDTRWRSNSQQADDQEKQEM
jgi:hypothetical protein